MYKSICEKAAKKKKPDIYTLLIKVKIAQYNVSFLVTVCRYHL